MNLDEAFGKALKRFRLANGMTQDDFTTVSGRSYMSMLERGKKTPTLEKIVHLAAAMNINPISLIAYTYLIENKLTDRKELLLKVSRELKSIEYFVELEKKKRMEMLLEEFE